MGGAVDGRGNTSPPTEFNIGADPEAAKIVFRVAADIPQGVWLIPWETSLTETISFSVWEKIIEGDRATARFVQKMTVYLKQVMGRGDYPGLIWPDPLAAAVALSSDIISEQEHRFVDVEIGSGLARGQTIVDYRPKSEIPPNVWIVRGVDKQKFQNLLRLAVQ